MDGRATMRPTEVRGTVTFTTRQSHLTARQSQNGQREEGPHCENFLHNGRSHRRQLFVRGILALFLDQTHRLYCAVVVAGGKLDRTLWGLGAWPARGATQTREVPQQGHTYERGMSRAQMTSTPQVIHAKNQDGDAVPRQQTQGS